MCEICNERMNKVPAELVAVLEKHRPKFEAIAKELGNDISKLVVKMVPDPNLDAEGRRAALDNIRQHEGYVSAMWALAYAATANDHDGDNARGLALMCQQALELGFIKSGQEIFQRNLN